jgi:hypothetical protein
MAIREEDERLKKLYNDPNINIYSISKLNTIDGCEYEAWNTYIQGDRGMDGVWGILGTRVHDVLENIMNDKATPDDLLPAFQAELNDLDMLDLQFPKDARGNDSIRDNYIANITHFCNNFSKPRGKYVTEKLVILKISDTRYVIGYIDLIKENDDDTITIIDWKTSSQFNTSDLLHHGRQLVTYALAEEQEGKKVKKVFWYMLKYVEVKYIGKAKANSKKETEITKVLERRKWVSELKDNIESDLNRLGYDEIDIEIMLNEAMQNNTLNNMPEEIRQKYKVKPYVREYVVTDELKQETLDYINRVADKFENKSKDESEWKPREFKKPNGKEDIFKCLVLCNHRKTCKYIKQFLELKDLEKTNNNTDDDLF